MASGFPVSLPDQDGLDIPFSAMITLSRMLYHVDLAETVHKGDQIDQSADTNEQPSTDILRQGVFFCAVDSILYPTSFIAEQGSQGLSKWHLEKSVPARLGRTHVPPKGSWCRTASLSDLAGSRCLLGYTPDAVVHLGTEDRSQLYKSGTIEKANARVTKGPLALQVDGFTLGVGALGGHGIATTTVKIKYPKSMRADPEDELDYNMILENARQTPIILIETANDLHRAWLVSELSVILELVHLEITRKNYPAGFQFAQLQSDGGAAAMSLLNQPSLARFKLRPNVDSKSYFRISHLIKFIWQSIEKRRKVVASSESSRGELALGAKALYGWDLLEVLDPVTALRRQIDLSSFTTQRDPLARTHPSWIKLTHAYTTFFCSNLGEIITPRDEEDTCCTWRSIPGDQQLLVASMHVLAKHLTKEEYCYRLDVEDTLLWQLCDKRAFKRCRRRCSTRACQHRKVQTLREQVDKNKRLLNYELAGAVIFGETGTLLSKFDKKLQPWEPKFRQMIEKGKQAFKIFQKGD